MQNRASAILALLLASLLTLSACGGSAAPETAQPVQTEAVQTESAAPETAQSAGAPQSEAEQPTPETQPEEAAESAHPMQVVEITLDNWQEYFELALYDVDIEGVAAKWNLVLKDEYVKNYVNYGSYDPSTIPERGSLDQSQLELALEIGDIHVADTAEITAGLHLAVSDIEIVKSYFQDDRPIDVTTEVTLDAFSYLSYLMDVEAGVLNAGVRAHFMNRDDSFFFRTRTWPNAGQVAVLQDAVTFELTHISGTICVWSE